MIYKVVVDGRDYYIKDECSAELSMYKLREKGYEVEICSVPLERSVQSLIVTVEYDRYFDSHGPAGIESMLNV